jgi:prepilin-type N-terminal cleavage/methylation domain-containing protein
MKSKLHRGFSLLEMLIVVSIGLILAGVGFIAMMPVLNQTHLNNAYDTTLMVLRNTRNQAITQSHEYYVYFNPVGFAAGTIQVQYQPPAVNGTFPPLQTDLVPEQTQLISDRALRARPLIMWCFTPTAPLEMAAPSTATVWEITTTA